MVIPTPVSLIEESQDLHTEAMAVGRATLPDLADFASDRRQVGYRADSSAVADFEQDRQQLIRRVAMAVGGVFGVGAVSYALPALLRRPMGTSM